MMNLVIPFESEIKYNYPVKEICSISLEHEYTKNDSQILGNFLITGTCKEHELSVNTKDFKFTLPFEVELADNILNDTVELTIDNFTYDLEENSLKVNINYVVTAEEMLRKEPEKEIIDMDPLDLVEDFNKEEVVEPITNEENDNERIMNNFTMADDYISYHIHMVKKEESLESICLMYKINSDDLLKINNITAINENDKLIIPLSNE